MLEDSNPPTTTVRSSPPWHNATAELWRFWVARQTVGSKSSLSAPESAGKAVAKACRSRSRTASVSS